jgi:hypothetical protein
VEATEEQARVAAEKKLVRLKAAEVAVSEPSVVAPSMGLRSDRGHRTPLPMQGTRRSDALRRWRWPLRSRPWPAVGLATVSNPTIVGRMTTSSYGRCSPG